MTLSTKERKEILALVPWLRQLKPDASRRCDGHRWSEVPMKAIYPWGPREAYAPTGLEPYRCKKPGYWRFRSLKRSSARDGVYCMHHLFSHGLHHDMDEWERMRRWYRRYEAMPEKYRGKR